MQHLAAQLCPTLCDPVDCSLPGTSVRGDTPGRNTGVGCHALLQGIFQPRDRTRDSCLLPWQACSLPLTPPWKPKHTHTHTQIYIYIYIYTHTHCLSPPCPTFTLLFPCLSSSSRFHHQPRPKDPRRLPSLPRSRSEGPRRCMVLCLGRSLGQEEFVFEPPGR